MSFWIWYDRLQVLSLGPCLQFEATKMGMWFPEADHSGSVESLVQKNRLFNQTWSLFCFCSISDPGCLTQRSHNLTQPVEVQWTWDTLGHEFRGFSVSPAATDTETSVGRKWVSRGERRSSLDSVEKFLRKKDTSGKLQRFYSTTEQKKELCWTCLRIWIWEDWWMRFI